MKRNLIIFFVCYGLFIAAGFLWAQEDIPVIEPRVFIYTGEISYTSSPVKTCLYTSVGEAPHRLYKVFGVPKNQQCAYRVEVYGESGSGEFRRGTPRTPGVQGERAQEHRAESGVWRTTVGRERTRPTRA